ncbi:MAG: ribosome silencing factor [Sphingomonadales bacterium]|nr:ribosome silencing factor [Sphingomonadales bacterium]
MKRTRTISQSVNSPLEGKALLDVVTKTLDDNKAQDVVVIGLTGKSDIADYLVVASGTSGRQVVGMAEHLRASIKHAGIEKVGVEGMSQGDWVLVDGGDVIIHLFRPEVRAFYNIEKMWGAEMPASAQALADARAEAEAAARLSGSPI